MQPIQTPFFTLTVDGSFISIESTGQAESQGSICLARRDASWVFNELTHAREHSFTRWAENPYPEECGASLLRVDNLFHEHGGRLWIQIESHPSSGRLILGEPEQEQEQLQALLGLHDQVEQMFEMSRPDDAARSRAAERALTLRKAAGGQTFLPDDGYCYRCGYDVTQGVTDASGMTGCPACHVSWCD